MRANCPPPKKPSLKSDLIGDLVTFYLILLQMERLIYNVCHKNLRKLLFYKAESTKIASIIINEY